MRRREFSLRFCSRVLVSEKGESHPQISSSCVTAVERQPGAVFLATGNGLFDEHHAFDTVVHIRINCVDAFYFFAASFSNHRIKGGAIDVCKRFEESFRVTQNQYDLGAVNFTDYQVANNNELL